MIIKLIDNLRDDFKLIKACENADICDIVSCIDSLELLYSDVLSMYYLHHHTASEIARLFGISKSTAQKRIVHGRKKLIQLLNRRRYHG